MDGLWTFTGTLALAYVHLTVHGVTPVLHQQFNKLTNEQTSKQTNKQTDKHSLIIHVFLIRFTLNFIRTCTARYCTDRVVFVRNKTIAQEFYHGTHIQKFVKYWCNQVHNRAHPTPLRWIKSSGDRQNKIYKGFFYPGSPGTWIDFICLHQTISWVDYEPLPAPLR